MGSANRKRNAHGYDEAILDGIATHPPVGFRNLWLVPLVRERQGDLEYLLGAEAIERGWARIGKVGEHGAVPELLAVTPSHPPRDRIGQ